MTGLFITFEGPDGAGKTTQVQTFAKSLADMGYDVLVTREPGGTTISDKIRGLILDPSYTEMDDYTEALLYAASRAQHVREKVLPALAQGKVVVCDRFVDASIAYQGFGLGLPVHRIKEINHFATGGLVPDRTYLLDIPVAIGRARLLDRAGVDRIEQKESGYHERVRDGFMEIASENPTRICLIDANRSMEEVSAAILSDFSQWAASRK